MKKITTLTHLIILMMITAMLHAGTENGTYDAIKPLAKSVQPVLGPLLDQGAYEKTRQLQHWCGTDRAWETFGANAMMKNGAGCPTQGPCDDPATRDAVTLSDLAINVIVHVITDSNDGGGVSDDQVRATLNQINADFGNSQTRIQFQLKHIRRHRDDRFACLSPYSNTDDSWITEIMSLKQQYAETPDQALNIFISCMERGQGPGSLLGIATFPWENRALSATGGLWLNTIAVGAGAKTAAHEIGHCLGLWHTFHGVDETQSCGDCYEFANGFEGNTRGDFCADTPPTPRHYSCDQPLGSDCQGTAWGQTQTENMMGYSGDACMSYFSPQQTKRMHCWLQNRLAGWLGQPANTNDPSILTNGQTVQKQLAKDQLVSYQLNLPANTGALEVTMTGNGDADIYVKNTAINWPADKGAHNEATFQAPYKLGSSESIRIENPAQGTWHLAVHGYEASAIEFKASWTVASQQPQWTTESADVQTPHPYENNKVYEHSYEKAGATAVALHFHTLITESGYDFVEIIDGSGQVVFRTSGSLIDGGYGVAFGRLDGWAIVAGNKITVRFVTDGSVNGYGLVINGTASYQ